MNTDISQNKNNKKQAIWKHFFSQMPHKKPKTHKLLEILWWLREVIETGSWIYEVNLVFKLIMNTPFST